MKRNIVYLTLLSASLWSTATFASMIQFNGVNKLLGYGGGQAYACAFSTATTDQFGYTYDSYQSGMCLGGTAGIQLGDFNGGLALEMEYNVASGNGKNNSGTAWVLRNRTYDGFARGQYGFEGMYWHGGIGSDSVSNSFFAAGGAGYRARSNLMYEAEFRYDLIDTFDTTISPYTFRAKVMYGINLP